MILHSRTLPRPFVLLKIFVGAFLLLSFLYLAGVSVDPDLGWHLRSGEWVLEHRNVPTEDVWTHTMPGYHWVHHEWLPDIFLWLLFSHNLWWITVMLFALLGFLPFFFWLRRANSLLRLFAVTVAGILMMELIGVRPQIISFALFFGVYELLRKKKFFVLPFLFFAWANLHAGFAAGLLLWGLMLTGRYATGVRRSFTQRRERGEPQMLPAAWSPRPLIKETLFLLISAGVTLINPYGLRLFEEIFSVARSQTTADYIAEWQTAFSVLNTVLVALLLALVVFCIGQFFRRIPLSMLLPTVVFGILFVQSARQAPLFFVTAMPLLFLGEAHARATIADATSSHPISRLAQRIVYGTALGLAGILAFFWMRELTADPYLTWDTVPEGAAVYLTTAQANGSLEGNLFNIYGWGGYLILRAPEIPVFIDGRMPHWGEGTPQSAMQDYISVFHPSEENERVWKEVFMRRNITTALLPTVHTAAQQPHLLTRLVPETLKTRIRERIIQSPLNRFVYEPTPKLSEKLKAAGWEVVYQDHIAQVLQCRAPDCSLIAENP